MKRRKHKQTRRYIQRARAVLACTLSATIAIQPTLVSALPMGGSVVGGSAQITGSGSTLDVLQQTDRAVINWGGFDIGSSESVQFYQPNSNSIALNRVISASASQIDGSLTANGNVFIINQNGVIFGSTAKVDVNGLVASTADIDDDRFMNNDVLTFDKKGSSTASIVNKGQITAKEAGLVGFVAPNVENSGVITAKLGRVHLASGDTVTVDMYGDGLMQVAVSDDVTSQVVSNTGTIQADGGKVALTAAAGKEVVNSLIVASGNLRAQSVGMKNGKIIIAAAGSNAVSGNMYADKGKKQGISTVLVSAHVDVSGTDAGETGGNIEVTADHVGIMSGAILDANGDIGGGIIRIGGDYHGEGDTPTALRTLIERDTNIYANALTSGNGGNVTIWSDETTWFGGNIEAKGGSLSGDGGFVEVSGKQYLSFRGNVNTLAANGEAGLLLLDPADIIIASGSGDSAADGSNTFAGTPSGITGSVSSGDTGPITIYESELEGIASSTSISLVSTNSITINNLSDNNLNLAQTGGRSVTFDTGSGGFIMSDINDSITTAGAALNITTTGGTNTIGNLNTNGGTITLNMGGTTTVSGVISGTGTSLTKSGSSTLILNGANTYTGNTTLSAGTVQIGNDSAFGTGTVSLAGATIQGDGTSHTLTNALSLSSSTTFAGSSALIFTNKLTNTSNLSIVNNNSSSLTFGDIDLSSNSSNRTLIFDGTGDTYVTGTIADGGTATASIISQDGTGTLTLSGSATYHGNTNIRGGTLRMGASNVFTGTSDLHIRAITDGQSALFDLNGFDQTIGILTMNNGSGIGSSSTINTGAGILTLGGNLTVYSTNDPAGATINGKLDLGGATRVFNIGDSASTANDLIINAVVSGTGGAGISKTGTGTLVLNGTNTYDGDTALSSNGILQIGNSSAFGTGTVLFSGGTLQGDGTTITLANDVDLLGNVTLGGTSDFIFNGTFGNLPGNRTLDITSTGTTTFGNIAISSDASNYILKISHSTDVIVNGIISNGGTATASVLQKDGLGTMTLNGNNTYAGTTSITGGTLRLGTNNALSSSSNVQINGTIAGATALFDLNNYNQSIGTLSFGGGGGTSTSTNNLTTGTGLLTVGGTISYNAAGNGLSATITGYLDLGNANRSFNIADSSSTTQELIINAIISGSGIGFVKNSTGTLVLNAANTYTGGTTLSAGNLVIGNDSALGTGNVSLVGGILQGDGTTRTLANNIIPSTAATIGGSSDLIFNGTFGNLTANRTLTVNNTGTTTFGNIALSSSGTNRTLTFDGTGNVIVNGVISNGGTATSSSIVKTGAGTLTLNGANTYAGTTTITGGTLNASSIVVSGGASNLGNATSAVVIENGGILNYTGSSATYTRGFTIDSGVGEVDNSGSGTLTIATGGVATTGGTFTVGGTGNTSISSIISGTGGAAKTGTGTLTLSGNNTFSNGLVIKAGTVIASTSTNALGSGTVTLGDSAGGSNDARLTSDNLTLANAIALASNTTGTLSLSNVSNTSATFTGGVTGTNNLTIDNTNTNGSELTISTGSINNVGTVTNISTGTSAPVTISAVIGSNVTGVTQNSSGLSVLTLSSSNTYTGPTTINSGTLRLGANNALSSSTDIIVNSTTAGVTALFDLNDFNQTIASLTLGGTGGTSTSTNNVSTGTGTLTLGGNITYDATGNPLGSTISGKLDLGSSGRTFTIGDSSSTTSELIVSAVISGSRSISKTGAGTLVLNAANTYSGGTTLTAGTIVVGSNSALGTSTLGLNGGTLEGDGTTRTLANNVTVDSNSTIGGTSSLIFNGGFYTGLNYDHTLTVNNSALTTLNNIFIASGALNRIFTIAGTGDVTVNGVISNGGTSTASALIKAGSGTLTLNGNNTYTGTTTINDGTLKLGAADRISDSSAVTVASGATLDLNSFNESITSLVSNGTVLFGTGNTLTTSGAQTYNGQVTGDGISMVSTGGGAITATHSTNDFDNNLTISTTGAVSIADANALALGNISASSLLARALSGNLTLNGQIQTSNTSGTSITLVSSDDFTNNFGATALQNGAGSRWLIYSTNPSDNTIGGLSGDFNRYTCTYGGSCPSVPASGNGLLYSYTPLLTVTPSAVTVTYGDSTPTLSSYTYSLSGYLGSDSGDDSIGGSVDGATSYTLGSNVGSYNISYSSGTLTSAIGYGFTYANNATAITVNPHVLSVVADALSKDYGAADPTLTYTYGALKASDTAAIFSGALSRAAGENAAGSPYAITIGSLSAGGNYTISFTSANFTINPQAGGGGGGGSSGGNNYSTSTLSKLAQVRMQLDSLGTHEDNREKLDKKTVKDCKGMSAKACSIFGATNNQNEI